MTRTVIPVLAIGTFKPARVGLIEGKAELLLGVDIIRELDITLGFGCDQSRVRLCELEMMTYNEKHHWVLPLVPTACAYNRMGKCCGKLRKSQISSLKVQGDCGAPFGSSESNEK